MNINKEKQEKAYEQLVEIANAAGIDFIAFLDEDIYAALEGNDKAIAKLNPEVCSQIRENIIELVSEQYSDIVEEAINASITIEDEDAP